MNKKITHSLLIVLAIAATPHLNASADEPSARTIPPWSWTTYLTAGLAAVTPYLAYKFYESHKAQPNAKKLDKRADALYKKLIGDRVPLPNRTFNPGIIARREEISIEDANEMISIAQEGRPIKAIEIDAYRTTIADYNKNRHTLAQGANHWVEMDIEDCLVENNSGMIEPKFRLRAQKRTTLGYGTLATLAGGTAAAIYFFGKK